MAVRLLTSSSLPAGLTEADLTQLQEGYSKAFSDLQIEAELLFVSKKDIQSLNRQYRNIDAPTDVLSFPTFSNYRELETSAKQAESLIGSIIICPEKADEYEEGLMELIHHGLLHLFGFDHEKETVEWKSEEDRVLAVLRKSGLIIPGIPHDKV